MKLLYVSTLDHIVRVMLPHLDGAKVAGYETHVACQFTRFKDDVAPHADGLHHIPIQRNPLDPRNLVALIRLIRLIRKLRPDIVHCHNPSGGFLGRLATTLAGTRTKRVYTAHGFHFHPLGSQLTNALYRGIESFAGRFLSDAVLTINQWDFEEAKKLMPPKRVYFTHGVGVSTDEFDPATVTSEERQAIRDEFGVPEDGLLITFIGEMIPRKRPLAALANFGIQSTFLFDGKTDAFPNARYLLVGDGLLIQKVKREIQEQNESLGPRFFAPGFRRDIKQILAATDIFDFPSRQEGLPCVVQEALSMEVPVICEDVRGCSDLVDESCGFVYRRNGGDNSALALRRFMKMTQEQRKALGRAGRQKMIEHYSRPVCVAEWLEIYQKISPLPERREE